MWIERALSRRIEKQAGLMPAIVVTGARQTGKSSLLRRLFPGASYVSLDRPAVASEAESNPEAFLGRFDSQVILDEVQYAPALFRALKVRIDDPHDRSPRAGRFLLTGSQKFNLLRGLSESLAGRVSVFELDTLSAAELRAAGLPVNDVVQRGGFPALWAEPGHETLQFYDDYTVTYLERDLRALIDVGSLRTFDRLLRALALRVGSLLNYAEVGKDVGVSPNTVKSWVGALETSGLVFVLPPYFSNETKRLVKTPKLYLRDNGLLCHLLRVHRPDEWRDHALAGKIFENFVFTELHKQLAASHTARALHFWRDKSGHEIDFLVEVGRGVTLIECKLAERVVPAELHFGRFRAMHSVAATGVVACTLPDVPRQILPDLTLVNPLLAPLPVDQTPSV